MKKLDKNLNWLDNIWMGITVEKAKYTHRIDYLKRTGAEVKFLSLEPLLGPIPDLDLEGIDWVIVGGESGPGCRVIKKEWVLDVREQCRETNTPFFFKQWGGTNRKESGRELEGRIWDEMPEIEKDSHLFI